MWNRTLAARHAAYATTGKSRSYAETDRALTEMKKDPELAWLGEVSSVPLQQALRHQHTAFTAFFAKRARYPRYKSRNSRQSASYTRSAFTMRGGALKLAKTTESLRFVWSRPDVDIAVAACGGDVRRSGATPAQSPVKQEIQPVREGIPRP